MRGNEMTTQIWADGFGLWHVVITDSPKAKRTAKRLIRQELAERGESSAYRLEMDKVPAPKGLQNVAHFVER